MSEIADLLEKLKQLDEPTYKYYLEGMISRGSGFTAKMVMTQVQEAWLQFCIQRAISAKGYHLLQSQDVDDGQYYAEISKLAPGYDGDTKTEKHLYLIAEGKGPSPCHALLSAYIACLEGQP